MLTWDAVSTRKKDSLSNLININNNNSIYTLQDKYRVKRESNKASTPTKQDTTVTGWWTNTISSHQPAVNRIFRLKPFNISNIKTVPKIVINANEYKWI